VPFKKDLQESFQSECAILGALSKVGGVSRVSMVEKDSILQRRLDVDAQVMFDWQGAYGTNTKCVTNCSIKTIGKSYTNFGVALQAKSPKFPHLADYYDLPGWFVSGKATHYLIHTRINGAVYLLDKNEINDLYGFRHIPTKKATIAGNTGSYISKEFMVYRAISEIALLKGCLHLFDL